MKFRLLGIVIVALHGGGAIWHLIIAAKAVPESAPASLTVPLTMIAVVHAAVIAAVWLVAPRIGAWITAVFFLALLALDLYEHFLGPVPTNVFRLRPGEWATAFRVSVFALLVLEIVGIALSSRILANARRMEPRQTSRGG